jgi:predicted acylesterase/phospholipase RssA
MTKVKATAVHQRAQGASTKKNGESLTHLPAARKIAIACQGGGAHAAYTAGVVEVLLKNLLNATPDAGDPKEWVGISGTSGGALSALVAWYGALEGGYDRSARNLRCFWKENCAQRLGEIMFNDIGVAALDLLNFDYQLNPYIPPLSLINEVQTNVWPRIAALSFLFSEVMRPDFFRPEAILNEFVEFEKIAALGRFLNIPAMIDAWHAAGARDNALDQYGLSADGSSLPGRGLILKELNDYLTERETLRNFAAENPNGLLAIVFTKHWSLEVENEICNAEKYLLKDSSWAGSTIILDPILESIRSKIKPIRDELPHLLVGAVDVGSGEFVAFSSQRAPENRGISSDSIRASTTIPWLFKGKRIPNRDAIPDHQSPLYWDGLFSQNPPISDFLSGVEAETKPDEIWVAQVNPQRCKTDDKEIRYRLWDRRNELSGNLSLNQEIAAAAAINARVALGGDNGQIDDKLVQIFRIAMDSTRLEESGRQLGPSSKMDRSESLMDELFQHGKEQAGAFLPVRDLFELDWNSPGAKRHKKSIKLWWSKACRQPASQACVPFSLQVKCAFRFPT